MRFARDFYIPKGAPKVASKVSSAVAYFYERAGKPCAMGFFGKADKPSFSYRFASTERRTQFVAEWMRKMDACQVRKLQQAQKKAVLAKPQEHLKVGDVLRCMWGYDQTNIDYYEVVSLFGKRGALIRMIACEAIQTGYMQGESVPVKGHYIGEPMRKQVNENGSVKVHDFGAWAYKLEPVKVAGLEVGYRPDHWTAYA